MSPTTALRDRSMRVALTPLFKDKNITGVELASALIRGLRDVDGQGARREWQDARRFQAAFSKRLSLRARRVMAAYATAARRDGANGFSEAEFKALTRKMNQVARPKEVTKRIDTAKEANAFFTTQWGPNRWNGRGPIFGFSDCAPTALVMALSAKGLFPKPSAKSSSRLIDRMRDLTRGRNTNKSSGTFVHQQLRGINAVKGARGRYISPALGAPGAKWLRAIRQGLAKGRTFTINGHSWAAWGRTLRARGQYLNSKDPGHHACAVLGMTRSGKFLVADPLSKAGTIAVSGERLLRFFRDARRRGDSPGIVQISRR